LINEEYYNLISFKFCDGFHLMYKVNFSFRPQRGMLSSNRIASRARETPNSKSSVTLRNCWSCHCHSELLLLLSFIYLFLSYFHYGL